MKSSWIPKSKLINLHSCKVAMKHTAYLCK